MQDRFKFRIWDKDERKMVYFDNLYLVHRIWHEASSCPQYDSCPHYHEVSEPMQCTGISDINNKLIYEGDILQVKDIYGKNYIKGYVEWRENYAKFSIDNYGSLEKSLKNSYEVIGNIYEIKGAIR